MTATFGTPSDRRLIRKAYFWVLPILCFMCFMGYLDRVSVAYAGPAGMTEDLALTATTFGLIGGVFTIGYVAFEIPGAFAMNKVGARRWMTIIGITWGALQAVSALMPDFWSLLIVRVLIGVAESTLIPTAYAFAANWFPKRYKPVTLAVVAAATGAGAVFGPIVATALMQSSEVLPFREWRFMMFVLGLLAIVGALVWWAIAANRPSEARWLNAEERARLTLWLEFEHEEAGGSHGGLGRILANWRAWLLGLGYFALVYASFAITIWAPTMVAGFSEQFGVTFNPYVAALLVGTPALCALIVQLVLGPVLGRVGRAGLFMGIGSIIGAAGCLLTTVADSPTFLIIALCLAAVGSSGLTPALLTLVPRIFPGTSNTMAFAIVVSVGASAGLFGPYITGFLRDATGNDDAAFYFMAAIAIVGGVIGVALGEVASRQESSRAASRAATPVPAPVPQG